MTDFKKLRSCNRALRFSSWIMFWIAIGYSYFCLYDRAGYVIGMAVFFRIIANEGAQ